MAPPEGLTELTMRLLDWLWAGLAGVLGILWNILRGELREVKDRQAADTRAQQTHIAKLYENAESDRKDFREALQEYAEASTSRHIELLSRMHDMIAQKQDK